MSSLGLNIEASSFAYQGIAGISTRVGRSAELFFEYRYFATDELDIGLATPIGAASAEVDITSNNYVGGIRMFRW